MIGRRTLSLTLKTLPPLIGLLCLTGCAGATPSNPNDCNLLPLKDYAKADQAKVADEIDAAPADAKWPAFVADYGVLRAAVRACRSVH